MDTKSFIERVVASGILSPSMVVRPERGVANAELVATENRLGTKINPSLSSFLRDYDGFNLDVIRMHSAEQLEMTEHGIFFANDPSGFRYYLRDTGEVICEDTDGGDVTEVAGSLREFLHSFVFGERSDEFMGAEWLKQIKEHGLTI